MKLVVQRVTQAKVSSEGTVVGQIGQGLFVLLGVRQGDSEQDVLKLSDKLLNLRIMDQERGKMGLSIQDTKGEILVVSQFTLYADTTGGRRPSFINAANPDLAKELYEKFVEKLRESELKIETGSFGSYMEIESVADGPVTILIEESSGKN